MKNKFPPVLFRMAFIIFSLIQFESFKVHEECLFSFLFLFLPQMHIVNDAVTVYFLISASTLEEILTSPKAFASRKESSHCSL